VPLLIDSLAWEMEIVIWRRAWIKSERMTLMILLHDNLCTEGAGLKTSEKVSGAEF
jgi:hypothetical protein